MTEKIYRAWHVCPTDMMTVSWYRAPRMPIRVGETLTQQADGNPECTKNGLHGSVRLVDAMDMVGAGVICLVDIWGDVDNQSQMIAGRYRKVLRVIPPAIAAMECRFFSAAVTYKQFELARDAGLHVPEICWDAIETLRRYAVGAVSEADRVSILRKLGTTLTEASGDDYPLIYAALCLWADNFNAVTTSVHEASTGRWGSKRPSGRTRVARETALSLELEDRLLQATGGRV